MKLTEIQLEAFGIWSNLALRQLSPQCTVFYGPNEAGKTTLLEFMRGMLYGFSTPQRARYLPPLGSPIASGTLLVATDEEGRLQIQRRQSAEQPLEIVAVEFADGTVQGEAQLQRLLHDVDERMFENVFAIGLRELQELGTLNDLEAARWLYQLSAGIDRISLSEILGELENSRARLMADDGSHSVVSRLQQRRDQLRQEVAELSLLSPHYGELLAEQAEGHREFERVEAELAEREARLRTLEAAVLIYDSWQRRGTLETQIAAAGSQRTWPTDSVARVARFSAAIGQGRRRKRRLSELAKSLRHQIAEIKVDRALIDQAPRIAALAENEAWLVSLEADVGQSELAISRLGDERQDWENRLQSMPRGVSGPATSQAFVPLSDAALARLRRHAATLRQAHRRAKAARQQIAQQQSAAQQKQLEVEAALAARKPGDLTTALQAAGERVSQLRNRVQLDERMQRLAVSKTELEARISDLVQKQILPPWTLAAVGSVFVLGTVLILGGLLLPASFSGGLGWPMAWLGFLGTMAAIVAKFTIERSLAAQLGASRKQMETLESQTKQARQERDESDRTLPKGAGALTSRLQAAEQDLAELEKLLPMEAQRHTAQQASAQISGRDRQEQERFQQALKRWRSALTAAGLPDSLRPVQVSDFAKCSRQWRALRQQGSDAQGELDRRRRELLALAGRVDQIFLALNRSPASGSASERLRQLRRELTEQESREAERTALVRQRQKLHRRRSRVQRRTLRLFSRRRRLLRQCGVATVAEFRSRAAEFTRISALLADRDATVREISGMLAGVAGEETMAALYAQKTPAQLEQDLAGTKQECESLRQRTRQLLEQSGRYAQQIEQLKTDRRLALKRYELGQVEQELAVALRRWQVLSVVWRLLTEIKDDYQRHRQPETLREASEYLSRFTAGRYRRVWTSLGENVLWVDDQENRTLSVDVLSRGTREQLLLSLRLALVSLFARRGIELPLVLDDVLVNFDTQRAATAIETLRDFGQRGHQLVMFTCHEHIARQCKACKLDVRHLPEEKQSGSDRPFDVEVEPSPRRSRARRIKDEAAPVDLPVAAGLPIPAVEAIPEAVPTAVPEALPEVITTGERPVFMPTANVGPPLRATTLRLDMPQRGKTPPSIMRRWAAEEFSGELDDRINPIWLLGEIATDDFPAAQPLRPIAWPLAGVPAPLLDASLAAHEEKPAAGAAASSASVLRLFAAEPTAIVVETAEEDDQSGPATSAERTKKSPSAKTSEH